MTRSLLRRFSALALALTVGILATPVSSAAAAVAPEAIPSFTILGKGNGHGIGLSQYGAQGYALHGTPYDQILTHYYQGTAVGAASMPVVKVNLDKNYATSGYVGRTSWTFRSVGSQMRVFRDADVITLPGDTDYVVSVSGSSVLLKTTAGAAVHTFGGDAFAEPVDPGGLMQIKDVSGPNLNTAYPNGYPYMRYRGQFLLNQLASDRIEIVNYLPMDQYLYGVVPRESPASWNAEALKAQAVAARSYAYSDAASGNALKCTTGSQVYGGHSRLSQGLVVMHEDPRTNDAVDQTAGKVVKYGSDVVRTYFFSASGGRTANIEDSWSYADPKPYYTGVEDPHEADAGSPYQSWTASFSGLTIASKLRASATVANELSSHGLLPVPAGSTVYVTGISISRGVSGYPRWVTFTFSSGSSVKLSGYTVKGALGLKSPNFTLSGFPIDRIYGANRYSTAVQVSKRAFGGTAPAVVLASGENFADALTGSGLAGVAGGPVLLATKAAVPSDVLSEIARLAPDKIYVMGGSSALSTAALSAAKAKAPAAQVVRVAGANRYETARRAADTLKSIDPPAKAIVAYGDTWADAAAASALAYGKGYPIVLTERGRLGSVATSWLAEVKSDVLLVGAAANAASVVSAVASATGKDPVKLTGANRYATAAAIASHCIYNEVFTFNDVYVATGLQYADALTGGVLAGKERHPLVLSGKDTVPAETATLLKSLSIGELHIFGGTGAISSTGATALGKAVSGG